jgi:hypothetical protein
MILTNFHIFRKTQTPTVLADDIDANSTSYQVLARFGQGDTALLPLSFNGVVWSTNVSAYFPGKVALSAVASM